LVGGPPVARRRTDGNRPAGPGSRPLRSTTGIAGTRAELEEFLYTHPDIADVQVIGVPDERYGEELCVWIIRGTGATLDDEDAIRDFCRDRLAHFKIPRYVMFVDEFPMTVTGKVQKFKMREDSITMLGLEDAAKQTA